MERSIKNNSIISATELVIDDLIKKSGQNVAFNRNFRMNKPLMYNLWMIADKKINQSDVDLVLNKLTEKNFVKKSEVPKLTAELMSSFKLRIAVLPFNCIDSVLEDMKTWFKTFEVEFVLNEFLE